MDRKDFIRSAALIMATPLITKADTVLKELKKNANTDTMPVIFIGHGNPMNAIYDNKFTQTLGGIHNNIIKHMYPNADIPTFQLSIDYSKPASYHYELAKQLNFLRNKGVLIIGSGNIVHNLGMIDFDNPNSAYPWATEFDTIVKTNLDKGD